MINNDETLRAHLTDSRDALFRALQHEHVPPQYVWHRIVGRMEWPQSRTVFNYFSHTPDNLRTGMFQNWPAYGGGDAVATPSHGLTLRIIDQGDVFALHVIVGNGRVSTADARAALDHYCRILTAVVNEPMARRLSALP